MLRYTIKRLLNLIPVALGDTLIIFTLLYITPGDPVKMMLGENIDQETYEMMREQMGLNDSFLQRYLRYVDDLFLHFDMGTSYTTKQPVITEILTCTPNTLKLTACSMAAAIVLGLFLGVIAAIRQNGIADSIISMVSLIGISFPSFWLGLMLILFFSVRLKWFPSMGLDSWKAFVLPCTVLAWQSVATLARMTRSSMLDVIRQDYVKTAKAKGLGETAIIIHHQLKNALIPIITVIGMDISSLLGGAVVCETIFSIQGIGRLMVDSIKRRDYPVVQGCVLFIAIICCVVNLVVDLLYMWADPRMKPAGGSRHRKEKEETEDEG